MSYCHAAPVLLLAVAAVAAACLPDNPSDTDTTETSAGTTVDTPTGGPATGLFACDSPPCTLVIVSQTLDDRVDIYDADTRGLRGRIDLDLKPDPTGKQIGVLLDEPYDLALTPTDLLVTLGHYPDTDRGSLLRFPRGDFADLAPGDTFAASRYFNTASLVFDGNVQPLTHARLEGIFLLPHPSGRVLIGVFANDLTSTAENWMTPSEVLVFDPEDLDVAALGSFDLGGLDVPCVGGWRLEPLNADVSKIGVACDGSKSIAVLTLPDDFATASPADAAAGITGCGNSLLGGASTITQFISADGGGGLLAVQSDLIQSPRLTSFRDDCTLVAYSKSPPDELADVKILRQPVLARPASEGDPIWLIASGLPATIVLGARAERRARRRARGWCVIRLRLPILSEPPEKTRSPSCAAVASPGGSWPASPLWASPGSSPRGSRPAPSDAVLVHSALTNLATPPPPPVEDITPSARSATAAGRGHHAAAHGDDKAVSEDRFGRKRTGTGALVLSEDEGGDEPSSASATRSSARSRPAASSTRPPSTT
jgi:hypothetical protein